MTKRGWLASTVCLALAGVVVSGQQQTAPPPAAAPAAPATQPKTNLGSDPNGNPLRLALKTGHISNYDESKVAPYTLPDPLKTAAGEPVRGRRAWAARRAEILRLYQTEIYGRIPANAPKVTWRIGDRDPAAREGASVMTR